jgi:uncharacterized membrane protein YfcA
MIALTFALATLIGLSLGLLGSGGSIVTLPVLVYAAGIPAHQAVGMSLVIVGSTSAIGSFLQIKQGNFNIRAAGLFALTGMLGAFIGGKFTHLVSGPILLILFGALMLIVGIRMLQTKKFSAQERKCKPLRCLAVGFAVGVLTGFLGVGGGFLILPALVFFAGLEMKPAIGTSLTIIAINSFAGVVSQLQHIEFSWRVTEMFIAAAAFGMLLGTFLATRFSGARLQRGFAVCVLLLGAGLIVRNLMLLF